MNETEEEVALMAAIIETRYNDWYNNRDELETDNLAADWSDRDDGETLSHAIVRNDIPWLLENVTRLIGEIAIRTAALEEAAVIAEGTSTYNASEGYPKFPDEMASDIAADIRAAKVAES